MLYIPELMSILIRGKCMTRNEHIAPVPDVTGQSISGFPWFLMWRDLA
jgi:hypothetical protein